MSSIAVLALVPDHLTRIMRAKATHLRDQNAEQTAPDDTMLEKFRLLELAWADTLDALAPRMRELCGVMAAIWIAYVAGLLVYFVWTS